MNDEKKSLGQVARDCFAFWYGNIAPWEEQPDFTKETWERAAQAVVAHLIADISSPENNVIFAAIRAAWVQQGAAEERERLAKMFEGNAGANRQTGLTRMVTYKLDNLIAIIRTGGKP